EIEGVVENVELTAKDDDGRPVTWRLAMFYGRYAGGTLQLGSDASDANWVAIVDLEKLSLTEGTASPDPPCREPDKGFQRLAFAAKTRYSESHEN
ncbi:MAG: hypothetical protein ABW031_02030, partial [Methyloceanibacter sp.]